MLRTHTIRDILSLRQCAAIAVLFAVAVAHSVVICTELHSPLQMHWRIPGGARSGKRGWCSPFTRRCRARVRVSRHSGQDDRHTSGDGRNVTPKSAPERTPFKSVLLCVVIPATTGRGCRRRVRYANTLFDPPTADRRHPVTTFPHAVFASLTCLTE